MSTAFRAIVSNCTDNSRRAAHGDFVLKAATFELDSIGPFPWPPSANVGKEVVVVDANELIPLLDQSVEVLNGHLESHQIDGEVKAHLERMGSLIAHLKPRRKASAE